MLGTNDSFWIENAVMGLAKVSSQLLDFPAQNKNLNMN